jgi:hypothetical protein
MSRVIRDEDNEFRTSTLNTGPGDTDRTSNQSYDRAGKFKVIIELHLIKFHPAIRDGKDWRACCIQRYLLVLRKEKRNVSDRKEQSF